jgi:hypothetical protein
MEHLSRRDVANTMLEEATWEGATPRERPACSSNVYSLITSRLIDEHEVIGGNVEI